MTKTIELAKQAGLRNLSGIEKFAELVRADERQRLLAVAGEPVATARVGREPHNYRLLDIEWSLLVTAGTNLFTADQVAAAVLRSHPSDERIMEVARRHWKLPGTDVIDFVRELMG